MSNLTDKEKAKRIKEQKAFRQRLYKERYHMYRELGFSSKDASRLRTKPLALLSNKDARKLTENKLPKRSKAETYRIRYQLYRDLGYEAKDARSLRSKAFNVNVLEYDKKTNKIIKNEIYKTIKETTISPNDTVKFVDKAWSLRNDTVYSQWGMLTHDPRYKDNTMKVVKFIQKDLNVSLDQAYYFLHHMTQSKKSYYDTKKELLSSEEFEIYRKKHGRKSKRK